mmetsp:Transcript_107201/g.184907  ORF Transcript_107201/g.184907 Transcript_107201/m.184907 type:complete len:254 (-) Transcript_107201:1593-2354(-)
MLLPGFRTALENRAAISAAPPPYGSGLDMNVHSLSPTGRISRPNSSAVSYSYCRMSRSARRTSNPLSLSYMRMNPPCSAPNMTSSSLSDWLMATMKTICSTEGRRLYNCNWQASSSPSPSPSDETRVILTVPVLLVIFSAQTRSCAIAIFPLAPRRTTSRSRSTGWSVSHPTPTVAVDSSGKPRVTFSRSPHFRCWQPIRMSHVPFLKCSARAWESQTAPSPVPISIPKFPSLSRVRRMNSTAVSSDRSRGRS